MTAYANKSFSVARGKRDPKDCPHGWLRENGECVWCGELVQPVADVANRPDPS